MSLHQRAQIVGAREGAIRSGAQALADEARGQRVQRLGDLRQMVASDLRSCVIGRGIVEPLRPVPGEGGSRRGAVD